MTLTAGTLNLALAGSRPVCPQSFALRLRTGRGGDLDEEFVFSGNGGTKRINQDDLAGDDVSVNEEQLRSHNFTVLYPEKANFSCGPFINVLVGRLVSPQGFALRLRTGGGGHLDEEFVLAGNGGT